jgi:hypothetical protein
MELLEILGFFLVSTLLKHLEKNVAKEFLFRLKTHICFLNLICYCRTAVTEKKRITIRALNLFQHKLEYFSFMIVNEQPLNKAVIYMVIEAIMWIILVLKKEDTSSLYK